MSVSQQEYNARYNEELRSPNVSRDEAIRRTNKAFGYGDSTAAQHPVTDEDLPQHAKPPKAQPKA
jgi:hypothetical protein